MPSKSGLTCLEGELKRISSSENSPENLNSFIDLFHKRLSAFTFDEWLNLNEIQIGEYFWGSLWQYYFQTYFELKGENNNIFSYNPQILPTNQALGYKGNNKREFLRSNKTSAILHD